MIQVDLSPPNKDVGDLMYYRLHNALDKSNYVNDNNMTFAQELSFKSGSENESGKHVPP